MRRLQDPSPVDRVDHQLVVSLERRHYFQFGVCRSAGRH